MTIITNIELHKSTLAEFIAAVTQRERSIVEDAYSNIPGR
jgi:hypothetical protein